MVVEVGTEVDIEVVVVEEEDIPEDIVEDIADIPEVDILDSEVVVEEVDNLDMHDTVADIVDMGAEEDSLDNLVGREDIEV